MQQKTACSMDRSFVDRPMSFVPFESCCCGRQAGLDTSSRSYRSIFDPMSPQVCRRTTVINKGL
jgi:hypothetical protein